MRKIVRDTGLNRAEDRMSAKGRAHEKATDVVRKGRSNVRDSDHTR